MNIEGLTTRTLEQLHCLGRKKSYYCCLEEINNEELFDGLLGYGLVASKIPPFLTGKEFLDLCKNSSITSTFSGSPRKYIHYESMRNLNVPRVLAIPVPVAYYHQCKILSENWDDLLKYFKEKTKNQTHKIGRIHIRKIEGTLEIFTNCYDDEEVMEDDDIPAVTEDHLFEMNHKNPCKDDYPEPNLLIGKQYMVKADISNCFPSIYSHSIPWALVGKNEAKLKSGTSYDGEWFNQIDEKTRKLKENETHGILIGPHSSSLISEIVLVAVDSELCDKYEYVRNVDDYTCYVEKYEDAEQFLVDLSLELKQFGLMLNYKKTEILKLPKAATESWVRKLNSFVFSQHEDGKLRLGEARAYLDIALDLMYNNKENSAILNYAIKVLGKKELTKNANEYVINTIHHLVLLYPYLVTLLDSKVFDVFEVESTHIEKIAKNLFKVGLDKKLYEAMSYSLYFAIKYDFKLQDDLFEIIDDNRDTVLMLLAYLHDKKFLNSSTNFNRTTIGKKYKKLAEELQGDIDEYWVFVYEVLTVGKLQDEWKVMKKNSVSFIKDEFK